VSYVEVGRRLHAGAYFGFVSPVADYSQVLQRVFGAVLVGDRGPLREGGRMNHNIKSAKAVQTVS